MDTKLTVVVLFIVFSQKAYCQSDRFNLRKTGVTASSVSLIFNSIPRAFLYHIKLVPRHSISNEQSRFSTSSSITLANLESNLVYNIQVQAIVDSSYTEFSNPILVRTAPGGCSIVHHFTTPSFITLFLEEVPGATEWMVKYSERGSDDIKTVTAPRGDLTNSYYVLVLDNLKPNTEYSVQARISQIYSTTDFTEEESPYGEAITIKTDKLLYFGRAVLINKPYDASAITNTTYVSKIDEDLTNYYKLSNNEQVTSVHVIEFMPENVTQLNDSDTLCYYEIEISATAPVALNLNESAADGFRSIYQEYNVAGESFYTYNNYELSGSTVSGCSAADDRIWIIHSDDPSTTRQPLTLRRNNNADNTQRIFINATGIFDQTISTDGETLFHFVPNTVYGIQHEYLVKTCQATSPLLFYDRVHSATNSNTPITDKYCIVYATGPGPMENSCDSVHVFAIDELSLNSSRLGFDIPRVSKAIHYKFTVMSSDGSAIEEISIPEAEIDRSETVQIVSSDALLKNSSYSLGMQVTTRLANGENATSPLSTFRFLTGVANATKLRITEVMKNSMKIIWDESVCASEYVISISNDANSNNYTAPRTTEYVIVRNDIQKISYNVSIASENGFGLSSFSLPKPSIFWKISNVTNSSFFVEWDGEVTDSQYRVVVSPTSAYSNTTTDRHVTLLDLEAGIVYSVIVSALSESGIWIFLFSIEQKTVPATPTNFFQNQSLSNLTSLNVVWDDVMGAEYFDVIFKSVSSYNGYSEERRSNTSSSFAVFTNLRAGRYYDVEVRSRSAVGLSDYAVLRAQTDKDIPMIEGTDDVTNMSFILRWNSALQAYTYKVNLTNLNTSSSLNYYNVNSTSKELNNLNPGNTYSVTVSATYETGSSQGSVVTYQTLLPSAPSHLSNIPIANEYSFGIAWNYSFGASNYEVSLTTANLQHDVVRTSRNYWKFEDVCGGARYDVSVRACNRAGYSGMITYQFVSAAFPPENVTITEVTENKVALTWEPVNCAVNYVIRVNSTTTMESSVNSSTTSFVGLNGGTTYEIETSANYSVSGIGTATSKTVTTAAANPPSFKDIEDVDVSNSSVTLSWEPQSNAWTYKLIVSQSNKLVQTKEYNSTTTRVIISSLKPAEPYEFQLFTISDIGFQLPKYENNHKPTFSYVITATNPPEGLKLAWTTDEKLDISYDEVEGAAMYLISLTFQKNGLQNVTEKYTSNDTQWIFTISDFQAVYYEVTLQALNLQNYSSEVSAPRRITRSRMIDVEFSLMFKGFYIAMGLLAFSILAGFGLNLAILRARQKSRKEITKREKEKKKAKPFQSPAKQDSNLDLDISKNNSKMNETSFKSKDPVANMLVETKFMEKTKTDESCQVIILKPEHGNVAFINNSFGEPSSQPIDEDLVMNIEDLDDMINTLQRSGK